MFKIFIVEDDVKIRSIISNNIQKWGYDVKNCIDYSDIINEFIAYSPHLLILDINLPNFDGFYWCNKIREFSKVPILFVSSRSSNLDIVYALNMGGDDFITKPFSLEVLMVKINALIRRSYSYTNVETNVIEHNGVILNLQENTVLFQNNKIELTKNEFKILYILMKNSGNIIDRDKIMRGLWEDEHFIDDNTLTVNINRLRHKLDELGLEEFIKTKKGQGYIIL